MKEVYGRYYHLECKFIHKNNSKINEYVKEVKILLKLENRQ